MIFRSMARSALLPGILALGAIDGFAQPPLKEMFTNDFLVGAALNPSQFSSASNADLPIIETHFNTITPENSLKWASVHPRPEEYAFAQADRFVEFGQRQGMFIVGHCLVWHSQTPRWVFEGKGTNPVTRDVLLQRMRDHIRTAVGRYKGKVRGWDVVNEALNEDGTLRQSPWLKTIGDDYLVKAFQFAHEADPDAELYYNDYGLEGDRKRAGALKLVKQLQSSGVKISGVGLQGHYSLDRPSAQQIDDTIDAFAKLGVKVMITELDVDVLPRPRGFRGADVSTQFGVDPKLNPYTNGLPQEMEQRLARRYAELFGVFLKHREAVTRVTFWGVTDRSSWLNFFPIRGRTNYPLLFDRSGKSKPAFDAVVNVGRSGSKK
jgi:endo-1,4-beta-xylanase